MNLTLKRTPGIFLVGFMGSGKTTVGRLLAKEMGWLFVDLDHDVETHARKSIADIFEEEGEAAFRDLEHDCLARRVRAVKSGRPTVVAMGGGAFAAERNRALIRGNGISIWLDCPLEICRKRVEHATHRPLARDAERMARLYDERREAYAQADYRIVLETDDSPRAFHAILALPVFHAA